MGVIIEPDGAARVKDERDQSWHGVAARWLFSQGATTVLLSAVLCFLGWFVMSGIPQHLTQIQRGYETIQSANEKSLERERVLFERAVGRIENSNLRVAEAAVEATRTTRETHVLMREILGQQKKINDQKD